jgi:DNA-binding transcriptional MerR regulator
LSGVSTKTLRFYDEIGLLRPASVDARTGYRWYRSQQLKELASILTLKSLGLSLGDVRRQLSKAGSAKDRRELLSELKRSIEQSIQSASQSLKWIDVAFAELDDLKRPVSIVVKHRPDVPIASVRAKVKNYSEILRFERELLNDLPDRSIGSLHGVLWHSCANSGSLEGEPFCELKHKVPSRSFYDVKQLPAASVACAYSGAGTTRAPKKVMMPIRKWMHIRNYRLADPKREIYLNQMLEIQFPLKSA